MRPGLLTLADWPALEGLGDVEAELEIGWLVDLVAEIRSVRAEMNVPPAALMPLVLVAPSAETRERAERHRETLKRLARLSDVSFVDAAPKGSVQVMVRGEAAALPLTGVIDIAAETARLQKEEKRVAGEIGRLDAKLNNADFVARAPEEVVEEQREKRDDYAALLAKVREALARVKGAA